MCDEAIKITDLSFDFGGDLVLTDVNLSLPAGSRCLLIGANGAGKSTLLKLLAVNRSLCVYLHWSIRERGFRTETSKSSGRMRLKIHRQYCSGSHNS